LRTTHVAALRRLRRWAWAGAALVAVLALGLQVYRRATAAALATAGAGVRPGDAGTPLGGTPAPGFTLTDQFGRAVRLADFRGRAVVLAFVDSECTTICPLTAATLREAELQLGGAARRVQFLAINVNPTATSVAAVRRWSAEHGMLHHWLFLTGSPERLASVWHAYHVYVQVVDGLVMHDPVVYVIGPHGGERVLFETQPSPLQADIAAQGRAIAVAAAGALGVRLGRPATGPVPAPVFADGGAPGAGAFVATPVVRGPGIPDPVRVGEGSPALVDFFASSCEACQRELPVLAAYARLARARHLPPAVLVYLDFGGVPGAAPHLARSAPFPLVADSTGALTDGYGVTALPYLAYTAADGRILWRHVGTLSLGQLLRAVQGVAGARPAG
jgi:cytochrome oxidase Cu insertion factor (SCO1/SenC/PrrC family)